MTDHLASLMGPVARELLGEPNKGLSSKNELRFGARGSLSVDLEKGVWHDHEASEGGGLLDLITRETGLKEKARFEWLTDHGYELPERVNGARPPGKLGPAGKLGPIVAPYDYVDEAGDFLFQVTRHDPKDFRQRTRNEFGEWVWSVKGVRQVPYHLPDLIEAISNEHVVFVPEGEKDVDSLRKLGIPATTNAGGAGKWPGALDQYFAGADVVIVADNDPQKRHPKTGEPMFHDDGRPILPGQDHAQDVARHLNGSAKHVRVLDLGKVWPACPSKGDISDWIAAGGTADALYALVEPLPDWDKADDGTPPKEGTVPNEQNAFSFDPQPYPFPDPEKIPRRQWLMGKHYIRGAVGATIGAYGRLKSTTSLTEMIGMACGRDLIDGSTLEKGHLRAAYLNGEETQDELDRRVAAICQHYGIKRADCGDRLWVVATRDKPIRVASLGKTAAINGAVVDALEQWCNVRGIDALAVDPLISFHSVRENANEDMDLVAKEAFARIAGNARAVDLVHHPRKLAPGESSATVDDGRGASALLAAVRVARVFNFMTPAEATQLGIPEEERRKHVRIDNGKASQGPLGTATWVKIAVENLPNGDEVACATLWSPPNPFDGVSTGDAKVAQGAAMSGAFRADSQSPEWLGWWMAENLPHLNIKTRAADKPKNKAEVARLNNILNTWVKNDVLAIEERPGKRRHAVRYYVAGNTIMGGVPAPQATDDSEQVTIHKVAQRSRKGRAGPPLQGSCFARLRDLRDPPIGGTQGRAAQATPPFGSDAHPHEGRP